MTKIEKEDIAMILRKAKEMMLSSNLNQLNQENIDNDLMIIKEKDNWREDIQKKLAEEISTLQSKVTSLEVDSN